jgi:mRNA-degrading endonuclease toxin of MazEF toxin-antitoxin module
VQGLASFDRHKLTRRLGTLSADQFSAVKGSLRELLQL